MPFKDNATLRRSVSFLIDEIISSHVRWRGPFDPGDGRITLLTVNWNTETLVERLLRSFRAFFDADLPVVVVDNSPQNGGRSRFRAQGARYITTGVNLRHGVGLDLGMRYVETEYTLLCDPDTVILSPRFREQIESRLQQYGVAAADTGNAYYHPLCVAFRTEHWKWGAISLQELFPYWDVGGALTNLLGGVRSEALIPKSRSFGPALPAALGGHDDHYLGEVYDDVFSSTYLAARVQAEPDREEFDGWPRAVAVEFHRVWGNWAEAVLDGTASVDDFPDDEVRL
ncbi:MAG TPA: glycosyltransferase [Acidimicrobiia bacterium]